MADIQPIVPNVYRISIFVSEFSLTFNQFLFVDDQPLLYHAGMRRMFPAIQDAVATVIEASSLRWVGLSHFEADECGGLNEWLALAPSAQPVCTKVAAMVNVDDFASRPARPLGRKDTLRTGRFSFRMFHTPQLPHGWDAGMLLEETTGLLLCSDLFHHNGPVEPVTHGDLLGGARQALSDYQKSPLRNYMPYTPNTEGQFKELADLAPAMLAPMHGPAYIGDGKAALTGLAEVMKEILGPQA